MRLVCLILALLVATALGAQDKAKKPPAKKQLAHKKATAEQIRKFNALHKKQQDLKR